MWKWRLGSHIKPSSLRSRETAGNRYGLVTSRSFVSHQYRSYHGYWAIENGLELIALTGFDGGRTAKLASVNLHVEGNNYGIIEDIHQSLMHLMGQFLRHAQMSEDLIQKRRF